MSAVKIHSARVMLVEGSAQEFAPEVASAAGMQGYAILLPPCEESERLLDMLWRISIAYAGMPRLLKRRANVSKMVEAVMSKRNRDSGPSNSPRKSELSDLTLRDRMTPAEVLKHPAAPNAKLRKATADSGRFSSTKPVKNASARKKS